MKTCIRCNEKKKESEFGINSRSKDGMNYSCKECHNKQTRESHKRSYDKNPDKYRERSKNWILKNKEKASELWRKSGKKYNEKLKEEAIRVYSNGKNECACCGEKETKFLSIDHIDGGGNKHRKLVGNKTARWLKSNGYPKGFQILCYNCNLAKGFFNECPHETNKQKK